MWFPPHTADLNPVLKVGGYSHTICATIAPVGLSCKQISIIAIEYYYSLSVGYIITSYTKL